jgi:DNA-binding CsgD family transcriptional regulator
MEHITIFLIFLNLIIGAGTAIYSLQLFKTYRIPFLKYLFYYIICYNLIVIVDLSFKYLVVNLFDNDLSRMNQWQIIPFLVTIIIAEYFTVVTLYNVLTALGSFKRSERMRLLFLLWGIAFGIAHIYSFWIFVFRSSETFFYVIHEFWIFSMLILIFLMLIIHILRSGSLSKELRKPNLAFAAVFLAGYAFFAFDQIDFYFLNMKISLLAPITLICTNLCPTVWLKLSFPNCFSSYKNIIGDIPFPESIDQIVVHFNISRREREIIEQIYAGKSNKEIEEVLNISFSTIKNHISNIYQKTGVHSRSQLISLINNVDKTV